LKYLRTFNQTILYKFKDFEGLQFLFSNSRYFKFCTNPHGIVLSIENKFETFANVYRRWPTVFSRTPYGTIVRCEGINFVQLFTPYDAWKAMWSQIIYASCTRRIHNLVFLKLYIRFEVFSSTLGEVNV
jgi:hypothetical protein